MRGPSSLLSLSLLVGCAGPAPGMPSCGEWSATFLAARPLTEVLLAGDTITATGGVVHRSDGSSLTPYAVFPDTAC